MVKILFLLAIYSFSIQHCLAQGKLSVGFDLASRKEIRSYHDPKGYLHRKYAPLFAMGGSLNYKINEKWQLETALYRTTFHETISAYYKEPGYIPMMQTGWQVNGVKTLQIPLRVIYDLGLRWKGLSFSAVGGLNMYYITYSLASTGEAFLSAIPVYPTPPTELMIYYKSGPLRKSSLAFELGGESKLAISERLSFLYRFTYLQGTQDMLQITGYYETSRPPQKHEFEVVSKGSALHHTFSLRYRLGKKKTKENWWEDDDQ
jgi:hypothetical protein